MMSMSSSGVLGQMYPFRVNSLMYRDVSAPVAELTPIHFDANSVAEEKQEAGPSVQETEDLISAARAEAIAETENRLRMECRAHAEAEAANVRHALENFQKERKEYFDRVESDVVHLALAIAAKILHREAQVDPMLIAGLVRVAIEKLHDGSTVSVRVHPAEVTRWTDSLANLANGSTVTVVADDSVDAKDCVLETGLGSAHFGIEAQLKEVEQGFFDLLAQRPAIK